MSSSYSHRITTRLATYSKTSATPSPVLADVKNSLGPRGSGVEESSSGVVISVAAFSRANRLGVMVTVLPELLLAVVVERLRTLGAGSGPEGGDDVAKLEEEDHGSGELRADWKTSKREEEGVW